MVHDRHRHNLDEIQLLLKILPNKVVEGYKNLVYPSRTHFNVGGDCPIDPRFLPFDI